MNQRLFRSRDDRVIAGVAGGLAAMLNVDPSIVRILWVILVPLTGGFIILLYFVMAVVVPEVPIGDDRWQMWDRPWPDPWGDQGTMGSMGPIGEPGATSPFDAGMGDLGGAGAAGLTGSPGPADATSNLGDDATRRYPPAGTISDLGTAAPLTSPIGSSATSASGIAPGSGPGTTSDTGTGPGPLPGSWRPAMDARRSPWQTSGEESRDRGVPLIFGLILVLIGAFFLARSYIPGIDWEASWPFLLVGIGIALLLGSLRRSANRP